VHLPSPQLVGLWLRLYLCEGLAVTDSGKCRHHHDGTLATDGTTPPKRQWGSRRRAIAMGLGMLDFGKLIADETEKWAKVIKSAGIKPV
jgi:hypothetical protein